MTKSNYNFVSTQTKGDYSFKSSKTKKGNYKFTSSSTADINSYVWKDARLTHDKDEKQVETRLIDMDEEQLQLVYNHCKDMLYNAESSHKGRMVVLDEIAKQLEYCGTELALRWFKTLTDNNGNYIYTNESLFSELRSWLEGSDPDENYKLKDLVTVPAEFRNIPINTLKLACIDSLGSLDHSKITYNFIYDLGLFLTQEELKEIDDDLREADIDPDKITLQTKIENHVKFPLGATGINVKTNPKGLSGTEFRDMIQMKRLRGYKMCKYSALSTSQLRTLRNKVLLKLEEKIQKQARSWKNIMSQIEEVAKYKQIKLN